MKILVTGAAGFVGSHIVRLLLERGKKVRVLIRPSDSTAGIDDLDVERMDGDVTEIQSLYKAVEGCEEIYHVAGVVSYWRGHREIQRRVNVDGVRNICRVALDVGIRRMVHTSSVVTMGFTRNPDKILDETSTFNQQDCGIGYVETKWAGEQEVVRSIEKGLEAVIVNPTTMFGERDYNLNAGELIVKIAQKKMPAIPMGGMNFIDVQDAAVGHLAAMERGRTGERYILGCENLDYDELFKIISEAVGAPIPRFHCSYYTALILGYLGNLQSLFTGRYPEVTPEGAKMTGHFQYYDSSKAVSDLGLPQTPVRESIFRAVNFYRKQGVIP